MTRRVCRYLGLAVVPALLVLLLAGCPSGNPGSASGSGGSLSAGLQQQCGSPNHFLLTINNTAKKGDAVSYRVRVNTNGSYKTGSLSPGQNVSYTITGGDSTWIVVIQGKYNIILSSTMRAC